MFKKLFKRNKKTALNGTVQTDSLPVPIGGSYHAATPGIQIQRAVNTEEGRQRPMLENYVYNDNQNSMPNLLHGHNSFLPHSAPSLTSQSSPVIQLSVSNSHSFTIGDVHNVTLSSGSVAYFEPKQSSLLNLKKFVGDNASGAGSLEQANTPVSFEMKAGVLDYRKLQDWHKNLISETSGENWRALGQSLDLTNKELADIELRTQGDSKQAVLGILQVYSDRYPDTSLGFVVAILIESGHLKAAEHLAKLIP